MTTRRDVIRTLAGLPLAAVLADPRLAAAAASGLESVRIRTDPFHPPTATVSLSGDQASDWTPAALNSRVLRSDSCWPATTVKNSTFPSLEPMLGPIMSVGCCGDHVSALMLTGVPPGASNPGMPNTNQPGVCKSLRAAGFLAIHVFALDHSTSTQLFGQILREINCISIIKVRTLGADES